MTNVIPTQAVNVQQWSTGDRPSPFTPVLFIPTRQAYAEVCHAASVILTSSPALDWLKDGTSASYRSVSFREDFFDQSPVPARLARSVAPARAGLAMAISHAFTNNLLVTASTAGPWGLTKAELDDFFANYHLTGITIYVLSDEADSKEEVGNYCSSLLSYLSTVIADMSYVSLRGLSIPGMNSDEPTHDHIVSCGAAVAADLFKQLVNGGWQQSDLQAYLQANGLLDPTVDDKDLEEDAAEALSDRTGLSEPLEP